MRVKVASQITFIIFALGLFWESPGLDLANVINIAESVIQIFFGVIWNSTFDLYMQVIQNVYAYSLLYFV